jgi:hypothetical protein
MPGPTAATASTRLADCDAAKCSQHRGKPKRADKCLAEACTEEVRAYVQQLIDRLDARASQAQAQRKAASELRAALRKAGKAPVSVAWANSVAMPALQFPRT